jgi:hypothetical protein
MAKRRKRTDEITATDPTPPAAGARSAVAPPPTSATALPMDTRTAGDGELQTAFGSGKAASPGIAEVDTPEQARQAATARPALPGPFDIQSIALSAENDGPRMRLLRSNKYKQMQIQFDEKPAEAVRERLTSEGWKWRDAERVWTKQFDPDARWRTQADAENLFIEIGDAVRVERGLSPTLGNAR